MNKIPLQIKPLPFWRPRATYALKSALPFIENDRGVLIHRPRYAAIHEALSEQFHPHMSVEMWCGSSANSNQMRHGGPGVLTFIADVPLDRYLCWRCEERAVEMGKLPSAYELTGHHVCVGGVRAYNKCPVHGEAATA